MASSRRFAYYGTVVFLMTLASGKNSSAQDPLMKSFSTEAPKGWKELRESAYSMSGTFVESIEPLSGLPSSVRAKVSHTVRSGPGGFIDHRITEGAGNDFTEYIEGLNKDYVFLIERAERGGAWKINRLKRDKPYMEHLIEVYAAPLFAAHSVDGQDLAWTMAQPGFRVNKLTPVS